MTGDAGELERLFQNLIGNALKYREPSRPLLIAVTSESGVGAVFHLSFPATLSLAQTPIDQPATPS